MNLLLTVAGLSIGLAATFLVALYALNESSYDEYQPDAERTYRVVMKHLPTGSEYAMTTPRGAQHFEKIPGVEAVLSLVDTKYLSSNKVKIGSEYFTLNHIVAAPAHLTDFVSIDVLHGNLNQALTQPYKIALSLAEARRLYGTDNAVGKTLTVSQSGNVYEVSAIYADIKDNSHYYFSGLIANKAFMSVIGKLSHTYLKLEQGTDVELVAKDVTRILNQLWGNKESEFQYYLQPILDIHLAPNFTTDMKIGGSEKTVSISIALAVLLIVISSFNYINMSVAQAGLRAKEVGVRKVLGATQVQLVVQFLTESVLVTLVAALLACALVELFLPSYNTLVGRQLEIGQWSQYLVSILMLTVAIGVISGLYPALFISSFGVKRVLSGDFGRGQSAMVVRKVLMVLQSALSVGLIVAAISFYLQLTFLQNLAVNYEKEQRIRVLGVPERVYGRDNQQLYRDLANIDGVISSTPTDFDLTKSTGAGAFVKSVPGVGKFDVEMGFAGVGFDAVKALGLQLIAGRDFSEQFQSDWYNKEQETIAILIPESVLGAAGYQTAEEAIGQEWIFGAGPAENLTGKIVGVVKDVKIGSSRGHANPVLFACGLPVSGNYSLVIEVKDQNSQQIKDKITQFVEQRLAMNAVELQQVSENYRALYNGENQLVKMVAIFSGLAVFLTCIGMFGLAAFSAQQRNKEVAIRKVLGASQFGLVALLTKESIALVTASIVIAFPLAFYFINQWLNYFNDRITQTPLAYLGAALLVATVTWLTVASIALRTASVRPSYSLRYE